MMRPRIRRLAFAIARRVVRSTRVEFRVVAVRELGTSGVLRPGGAGTGGDNVLLVAPQYAA